MSDFALVKSFGIDDGQLNGLSVQECFVLGYELAQVDALLECDDPISRPVHAHNRERIETACRDARRPCTLSWLEGDVTESWLQLDVGPRNQPVA